MKTKTVEGNPVLRGRFEGFQKLLEENPPQSDSVWEILDDRHFLMYLEREHVARRPITGGAEGMTAAAYKSLDSGRMHMLKMAGAGDSGLEGNSTKRIAQVVILVFGEQAPDAARELVLLSGKTLDPIPDEIGSNLPGQWMHDISASLEPHVFELLNQYPVDERLPRLKRMLEFATAARGIPSQVSHRLDERMPLITIGCCIGHYTHVKWDRSEISEKMRASFDVLTCEGVSDAMVAISADDGDGKLSAAFQTAIEENPSQVVKVVSEGTVDLKGYLSSGEWKIMVPAPTLSELGEVINSFIPGARPSETVVDRLDEQLPEPEDLGQNVLRYDFGEQGSVCVYEPLFGHYQPFLNLAGLVENGGRILGVLSRNRAASYETPADVLPGGTNLPYYEQWIVDDPKNLDALVCSRLGTFRRHKVNTFFNCDDGKARMLQAKIGGDEAEHREIRDDKDFWMPVRVAESISDPSMVMRPVMLVELPQGADVMYGQPRASNSERIVFYEDGQDLGGRRFLEFFPNVPVSAEYVRIVSERSGIPLEGVIENMIVEPFKFLGEVHEKAGILLNNDAHANNWMLTPNGSTPNVADCGSAGDISNPGARGFLPGDVKGFKQQDRILLASCFRHGAFRALVKRLGLAETFVDDLVQKGLDEYGKV